MRGRICIVMLLSAITLCLNSCGGGGGGVGTISSSSGGTFSVSPNNLDSDVAKWTGTPTGTCAGSSYSVSPDSVDVTFTAFSAPAGSTGNTPEKVVIDSVSIIYTKSDGTSPDLQSQYPAISVAPVTLGSSVTFPVRVVSDQQKDTAPLSALRCSPNFFNYRVLMVFYCHYLVSGDTFQGSKMFNLTFADFKD